MKLTKRILSLLVCMALVIGFIPVFAQPARAEEQTITWDASVLGKTTITFKSTIVGDNLITLSASKNGGSNDPAYNKDGTLRLYNKNQLVITPSANITLTKVEFVTTGSSYDMDTTNFSVSAGTLTTGTKTASITNINGASSITLTSSKSSQIRISDIIFTYTTNGGNTPACTHADATITHNNGMHIKTCPNVECGVVEEEAYTVTTAYDANGHWEEYSCGCKTESAEHTLVDEQCECGYVVPETDDYVKVTNVSDLKVGDKIIIVAAGYDYALSTTQNTNNRAVTAITKNADKISVEENGPVQILTLEAGTVEGTFAFYTGSGYLYAASSSSNNLKTQTTNNDNGSWLITIDAEGVASIIAQGSNTRNVLKYNSSSTLFSCYDSNNSQLAVAIYKLQKETHTHNYAENVTAPTCTAGGYTTFTCACGHSYVGNEVAATGHNHNAVVTAPTCTAGGYTTYTCACGDSYTADATEATGHAWGEGVVNPKPTCNDAGTKTYTCGNCNETKTEAVSALGHTAGEEVVENEVAATCTAAGSYDKVVRCTVCGAELSSETITVDAIGHNYTSEITTQPTYNTEGVKTFTCSNCGDSYTESISATVTGLTGSGTVEDPYLINNLDELKWFRDDVNNGNAYAGKIVALGADIDLASEEWTPIGTSAKPFNGIFDGKGKTISNLVINGGSKSDQGFFGRTNNGEIKNLTIHNAKVSGRLNVAVVAGTPYTSKYTNIKITGHVEVNGMAYVGGVGGKNAYANWTDITVDVDATSYVNANSVENGNAYRTYVGGITGFNGEGGHTFKNISSNIKVIGSTCDIGGLFGIAHYDNKYENVTFTGSVEAPEDAEEVGGIAGVWHNEKGHTVTFTDVTSTGTVTVGDKTITGSIVGGAYNPNNETPENSGSLKIDGVEVWLGVAKIGDEKFASVKDALEYAKANNIADLVITIIGANTKETADDFGLYEETAFNSVVLKQNNGGKPYYVDCIHTGKRTDSDGVFVFDGVNLVITGQFITQCTTYLVNNSTVVRTNDVKNFIYYADVIIEAGSKYDSQIDDILGGSITVDGGLTSGYNNAFDFRSVFFTVRAGQVFTLQNGAYAVINAANEIGSITLDGNAYVIASKLDVLDTIAIGANGLLEIDVDSIVTAKKITGSGVISIDATGFGGSEVVILNADLSGFNGTIEVIGNADYKIVNNQLVVSKKVVAQIGDVKYTNLAEALNACQKGETVTLLCDIDLNNEEWTPIASFKGTLDGNSYTIKNLKITHPGGDVVMNKVGLIGQLDGGTIKNLTIENVNITGSGYVGAVAGNAYTGKIENVTVKGNIQIAAYQYVGGIAGHGYADIVNCHVIGDGTATSVIKKVAKDEIFGSGTNGYVGGIKGQSGEGAVKVLDCSVSNITITTNDDTIGGISGILHYGNIFTGNKLSNVVITAPVVNGTSGIIAGDVRTTAGTVNTYDAIIENVVATAAGEPLAALGTKRAQLFTETISGNVISGVVYDTSAAEAKIGTKYYFTLADAIAAAEAGQTIVLLKDVVLADTLTIEKSITLDLNDKTLTGADGKIVLNIKAATAIENGTIIGNKSGTSSGLIDIYADLTMDGVTVETSKILALRFKAGSCTATLTDCTVTGAFKGYGGSVWEIKSGTYKASSTSISEQLNGTAVVSGGVFHYEIKAVNCAPGYAVVDNGDGTYTVEYAPVCFVDANNNGVLDDGEQIYGSLEAVFNLYKTGDVYIVLLADAAIENQVDTDADAKYYLNTSVEDGVTVDFLFGDDWNYVQKMYIGENVTLNAPYLLAWTDFEVYGTINTTYFYTTTANVLIAEGAVVNVTTGEATVQVKNGATFTVNGTVNAAILNVWVGESKLIVSGENANVNVNWIDIWDGTPSVIVENGATLAVNKIKASRGGSITVNDATLTASSIELGHNGESAGTLTTTNAVISGNVKLTALDSTLAGPEGLNVTTEIADYEVVYENGVYKLAAIVYGEAAIGDNVYDTLQEALDAAIDGGTIKLLKNVQLTSVTLLPGMTLDLNGYTVEALYFVGLNESNVIDSSKANTGLLKVAKNRVMLSVDNEQLPVYNSELGGYQFLEIKINTGLTEDTVNDVATFQFYIAKDSEDFQLLLNMMKDGAASINLSVMVKLTWTTSEGNSATQYYAYSEDVIKAMVAADLKGNYGVYKCVLNGISSREDISYAAVLQSTTKAEIAFAKN